MDVWKDEDEVWNIGSEHESMKSECGAEDGNCGDTESEIYNRNNKQ
jgi:hypothetical protein